MNEGNNIDITHLFAALAEFSHELSTWLDDDNNLVAFTPLRRWHRITQILAKIEQQAREEA